GKHGAGASLRAKISAQAVECLPSLEPNQRNGYRSVARRRYQRGSIKFVRGRYIGRWREDVVEANGAVKRVNRKKVLGTKADFATKREAQRALDVLLAPVNSLN